jgi:hypothetical protein
MDFVSQSFGLGHLATIFVYGLWNDWNIYSMLYRELEYDEFLF